MAFRSPILQGSTRLDQAAAPGGRPIRPAPPPDDPEAVRRIQKALRDLLKIPMKKSFVNGPDQEPDGKFGNETREAVIDFQRRAFPNDPRQHDGHVGPLTLAEMDKALGSPPPPPNVTKTFVDVVVRFVGGRNTGENLDSDVLVGMSLLNYNRRLRSLIPIGRGSRSIQGEASGMIAEVMSKIKEAMNLPGIERGIICVYGSSAGGRNAIELAGQLNAQNLPLAYVGVEDAAFFPIETSTVPNTTIGKPTNIPVFDKAGLPFIRAERKFNFFQTFGNHVDPLTFSGRLWTSKMAGKEVHGDIPGIDRRDLSSQVGATQQADDDLAHSALVGVAIPEDRKNIAEMLVRASTRQTPLPP